MQTENQEIQPHTQNERDEKTNSNNRPNRQRDRRGHHLCRPTQDRALQTGPANKPGAVSGFRGIPAGVLPRLGGLAVD